MKKNKLFNVLCAITCTLMYCFSLHGIAANTANASDVVPKTADEVTSESFVVGKFFTGDKKSNYDESQMTDVTDNNNFKRMSTLKISSGSVIPQGNNRFAISGNEASILIKISQQQKRSEFNKLNNTTNVISDIFTNSFVGFEPDTYGKKEDEKIADTNIGEMGYGAIIVQCSTNGINWGKNEIKKSADYLNNKTSEGYYIIYTPKGADLYNGIFIRVIFAYKYTDHDVTYRAIEKYQFYVCVDNLDAVTFKNLSAKDSLKKSALKMDECQYKAAVASETLKSGDMTVTGFRIDTSLCPSAAYTVTKNGKAYSVPENKEIRESGFYEIKLTSKFGKTKYVSIYVDTSSDEELLDKYFVSETLDLFDADNIEQRFLLGKRIYKEGNYPVFEAGELFCCLKPTPENCLPVTGYIKNTSKNTKLPVQISSGDEAVFIPIDDPGEYIAKLNVGTKEAQYVTSGDIREVTFKFTVIEKGTAPGPIVNKNNLENIYSFSAPSDYYPLYYAVEEHRDDAPGSINLAYYDYDSALERAKDLVRGNVEKLSDGSFRYNGNLRGIEVKPIYHDGWDLNDAVEYFADAYIELKDFDLSVVSSYLTLDDSIIKQVDRLLDLKLKNSITVFPSENNEKDKFRLNGVLPLICEKPQAVINDITKPEIDFVTIKESADFKFIHDKYGCDSNTVTITNEYGQTLNVRYNVGVGKQLSDAGFLSGIVTITETTFWDDSVSYQALYIADGDNQAKVTLTYYEDGVEKNITADQHSPEKHYYTDAFRITDITDELDKYSHISVSYMRHKDDVSLPAKDVYDSDHLMSLNDTYITPGDYEVKVINRVGNAYTFTITVTENGGYLYLSFAGDGTEGMDKIFTKIGMQNVSLQNLSKYGYDFIGFKDSDGTLYKDSIGTVLFTQDTELTSAWSPKTVKVILKDPTGTIINTQEVHFGSDIELPALADTEEMQFAGWDRNGAVISGKMIIDTEEDIVLTASFSKKASSGSDGFVTFLTYFILCLPVLVVVAIIIVILVIVKKIKKHKKTK